MENFNSHKIQTNDLLVEFISNKQNQYNNEYYYFKVIDKDVDLKLKYIIPLFNKNLLFPIWKTPEQEYIIKVKEKHINNLTILKRKEIYSIDVVFNSFIINNQPKSIEGYFSKINKISLAI